MPDWDANLYLKFGNERTQPAIDLASRIQLVTPERVIDLGCGPGNSTEILRQRWPQASVIGVDHSEEMISAAREKYPECNWLLADAANWQPDTPVDVVFSNAVFQWIPDHERLLSHLMKQLKVGGVLAFQIPSHEFSIVHQLIMQIADHDEWSQLMAKAKNVFTIGTPGYYYDVLSGLASRVDLWETEYFHVMENHQAIVTWMSGTGLRPFLEVLQPDQQNRFKDILLERVKESYMLQQNNKVLFPFRRIFVVATR